MVTDAHPAGSRFVHLGRIAFLLGPVLLFAALPSIAAEDGSPSASTPRLDRTSPKSPSDSLAEFQVAPGFRIEQVAAEPMVHDPVAIDFDENGVAFVAELPPYNAHAKPGVKVTGAIRRLEDVDGDGKFDKSAVFADNLRYPSAVFCYGGGLYVGDSPDLLYLRDSDGDGRADERTILYTGFGVELSGEGRINSFRWGLDNRIHIAVNHDGGDVRPPNSPDAKPISVRKRTVLLDPRTNKIELTSGSGQHGLAIDDWGRSYVCENSNPFIHLLYDDRYIARNPLMNAPAPIVTVRQDNSFTNLMRISAVDPWRIMRLQMRMEGKFPGPTEGGRVSGFFTAATGVTIYRGDAWPAEYRGSILIGEVANNLIYRALLHDATLSVTASRADPNAEFLASSDPWFRPVQLANAPDGNLYVLDLYRELIETTLALPPELLSQLDPLAGVDRGRIYRIVPENFGRRSMVRLGKVTTTQLVALLEHANGWHRDTASRLLYERRDPQAIAPLRRLVHDSAMPEARVHALWTLDGLSALKVSDVLRGLSDDHSRVREHALRLAERFADVPDIHAAAIRLADDNDERVRFQAAFSLGAIPANKRIPALLEIIRRDGASHWFRMAVQSSLADGASRMLDSLIRDQALRTSAHGKTMAVSLVQQLGRTHNVSELASLARSLEMIASEEAAKPLARQLAAALLAADDRDNLALLREHANSKTARLFEELLADARRVSLDSQQPVAARTKAIESLTAEPFAAALETFEELLQPAQHPAVQQAALSALGKRSDGEVGELVLEYWPSMTPQVRAAAAEMMLSRPAWTSQLLDAVEAGDIAAADISTAHVSLLNSHPDAALRTRAATVLARPTSEREGVIAQYQQALQLTGDVERGRQTFRRVCAACHQLEDYGTSVGADLKAIADRGMESVLLNILDPNRDIKPQFLTYLIVTMDGRALAGIITEETTNNLTLRTPDGQSVAISRDDIEEIRGTGLSYMPEGLEKELDMQAMADVLAYLAEVTGAK